MFAKRVSKKASGASHGHLWAKGCCHIQDSLISKLWVAASCGGCGLLRKHIRHTGAYNQSLDGLLAGYLADQEIQATRSPSPARWESYSGGVGK